MGLNWNFIITFGMVCLIIIVGEVCGAVRNCVRDRNISKIYEKYVELKYKKDDPDSSVTNQIEAVDELISSRFGKIECDFVNAEKDENSYFYHVRNKKV